MPTIYRFRLGFLGHGSAPLSALERCLRWARFYTSSRNGVHLIVLSFIRGRICPHPALLLGLRPSGLALRASQLLPGGEGSFGRLVPLPLGESAAKRRVMAAHPRNPRLMSLQIAFLRLSFRFQRNTGYKGSNLRYTKHSHIT